MRGTDTKQSSMLMLMSPESRVPTDHPLRAIKKLADAALTKLSPVFDRMYSSEGRPSIPPERLLKSMLLMALYTVGTSGVGGVATASTRAAGWLQGWSAMCDGAGVYGAQRRTSGSTRHPCGAYARVESGRGVRERPARSSAPG